MLTEFGQFLRKLRIDCNEFLKDMADKLGVTPSYLSAVETGKRKIPDGWVKKICEDYKLDMVDRDNLEIAATRAVTMDLGNTSPKRKETALLFARTFDDIDDSVLSDIRNLLNKSKGGK